MDTIFLNYEPLMYDKVVYISHPYGGDPSNKQRIEDIIINLRKVHKNTLFLSAVHQFSFLYDITDYEEGIQMCLWLLSKCDEIWVFGDYNTSRGCKREMEYAQENDIPMLIEKDMLNTLINDDACSSDRHMRSAEA